MDAGTPPTRVALLPAEVAQALAGHAREVMGNDDWPIDPASGYRKLQLESGGLDVDALVSVTVYV